MWLFILKKKIVKIFVSHGIYIRFKCVVFGISWNLVALWLVTWHSKKFQRVAGQRRSFNFMEDEIVRNTDYMKVALELHLKTRLCHVNFSVFVCMSKGFDCIWVSVVWFLTKTNSESIESVWNGFESNFIHFLFSIWNKSRVLRRFGFRVSEP